MGKGPAGLLFCLYKGGKSGGWIDKTVRISYYNGELKKQSVLEVYYNESIYI